MALELGKKLGIPVFDNELLTKAAQDSGFSAEFFARSDEKRRFFSLSSIFTTEYSSQTNSYMSDKDIFSMQCETIRSIAEHGPAIIVGRCADYVLRELDCTLDVFITAPQAVRVGRIVERLGLSDEKALELMERKDKGREEYYNYYTFGNWGVASTYDLCLDSSILGVEGTADFIIEYARRAGLL